MPDFTLLIKRHDIAHVTVNAENEAQAEDIVWDWIENDYDKLVDLRWIGDHDVRAVREP